MGLKCGIVGLPNVGKSTLFNALTAGKAAAENYAFCTIDQNIGIAEIADSRLAQLAAVAQSEKIVPTAVEFVDIAGLVRGASQNAGLGNRFLSHIREAQGIAHVARCFVDGDIAHVEGRVRPREDIDIVNLELSLADLATVEKIIDRNRRPAATGEREARAIVAVAEKIGAALAQGLPARAVELNEREAERARAFFLLTAKPVLYVANVDEGGFGDNPLAAEVAAIARADGAPLVPVCARLEAEIADMSDAEKLEFLRDLGLAETGLGRLARAAHEMLGLSVFFTAGRKEARAWTFRRGICAREAAGVIHTDFAKKFIRAEVAGWEEYLRCGGETGAREAGKMRLEGADYVVREGDVIHFRVGA